MASLAPCWSCHRHIRLVSACPFCGADALPAPAESSDAAPRGASRSELALGLVVGAVAISSVAGSLGCCFFAAYGGPPMPAPAPTPSVVTTPAPSASTAAPEGSTP